MRAASRVHCSHKSTQPCHLSVQRDCAENADFSPNLQISKTDSPALLVLLFAYNISDNGHSSEARMISQFRYDLTT